MKLAVIGRLRGAPREDEQSEQQAKPAHNAPTLTEMRLVLI
jgi:hypothetical protein